MDRRGSLYDFLTVVLSTAVIATGAWLFWRDMTATLKPTGAQEIGIVTYKRKAVQRKYTGRTVWEEVKATSALYPYDAIRTQGGSEALITLDDGTEITLDENTLIVLDYDRDNRNIQFLSGSISARAAEPAPAAAGTGPAGSGPAGTGAAGARAAAQASPPPSLTISSGGTKVAVKEAEASLSVSAAGKLDVEVARGTVQLEVQGRSQEIKEDQRATVEAQATVAKVEVIPVTLTSPAANAWFLGTAEGANVPFAWRSAATGTGWILEVAKTPAFEAPLSSATVDGLKASMKLAEGQWYARVRPSSGESAASNSGLVRFNVAAESPPLAITPAMGSTISFRSERPSLRFVWEGSTLATSWQLEISREASFATILLSLKSGGTQVSTNELSEGDYWWRVRPWFGFGGLEWGERSAPSLVSISKIQSLAATESLSPREGETVFSEVFNKTGIRFGWKSDPETELTTLSIARDQAMSDVILRSDARGSSIQVSTGLLPGTWWWQASSRSSDGTVAPPSTPRSFTITDKVPTVTLREPAEGSSADALVDSSWRFSWECDMPATFLLELARDRGFSNPLTRETSGFALELKGLEASEWYWRVTSIGPGATKLSTTPARSFVALSPLAAPILAEPVPGSSLDMLNKASIGFSWRAVPDADAYSFRLLSPAGKEVAARQGLTEPSLDLTGLTALTPGRHEVELRATQTRGGKARSSPASRFSFDISRVLRVAPPDQIEPVDRASYTDIDVKRAGIVFAWKADPATPRVRFSLATDSGFRGIVSEEILETGRISFKRLDPGSYFWRVVGLLGEEAVFSSAVRSLEVNLAPPLAAPVMVFPASGAVVDMSSMDSLRMSWKPVSEATHYSASLVNRKTGVEAGSVELSRSTVWDFTALENLDVAQFRLKVQAFSLDAKGSVERRGTEALVDFRITLSGSVGAPEIITPGILFRD